MPQAPRETAAALPRALGGALALLVLLVGCAESRVSQGLDDLRTLGQVIWESAQGWEEREGELRARLAERPGEGALHALLGLLHLQRRRYAEAREAFGRAVVLAPDLAVEEGETPRYRAGAIRPFPEWASALDSPARDWGPLYLAIVRELEGSRFRAALRRLDAALPRLGADPLAGLFRAEALLGAGELAVAAPLLERLQRETQGEPYALALRGEVYLRAPNYAEAVRHLEEARSRAPGFARPLLPLGRAYLSLKEAPKAIPVLEEAARRAPGATEAHAALAEAYLGAGRLGPASGSWKRAVELAPKRADYRLEWARTLEKMGSVEDALARYAEAARLAPREPAAWVAAVDLLARSGRAREAVARAREGARQFPARAHLFHNRAARALLQLKEPEAAGRELESSLASDPSNAEAQRLLGQAYERRGRGYLAAKHFRRYAELSPHAPDAPALAKRAGEILAAFQRELDALAKKGPVQAVAHLRELLRESPEDGFLNLRLGEHYRELGFFDRAEAHLRRAVEAAPGGVENRLALARLYREQDQLEKARAELERAWNLAPESRAVALERGLLELRRGRLTEAVALLQAARQRGAPAGRATLGLLRAYALRGEVDRALLLLLDEAVHLKGEERLILQTDPVFSPLWRDPRFAKILGPTPDGTKAPGSPLPSGGPPPPEPPYLARVFLDGSREPIPGRVRVLAVSGERVIVELIDLGGLRRVYGRGRVLIEPLPVVGGEK